MLYNPYNPYTQYDRYDQYNQYTQYNQPGFSPRNNQLPQAAAVLKAGPLAPQLRGMVTFSEIPGGVRVCVEVSGLPPYKPAGNGQPQVGPHGFHIHQNGRCEEGDPKDPFQAAGGHWNPDDQPHGNHANKVIKSLINKAQE